jgi:hypothetical protein
MRNISLAGMERRFISGGVGGIGRGEDGEEEESTRGEVIWDISRFVSGGAGGCAGGGDDEEEELTGGKFVWDIGDVTSIAYGVAG